MARITCRLYCFLAENNPDGALGLDRVGILISIRYVRSNPSAGMPCIDHGANAVLAARGEEPADTKVSMGLYRVT
jgi:hypothetical protein